jgi:pyruvate formate-lyase activating enzyme-like uncharacterized protein
MILDVTQSSLSEIRNPVLRTYAEQYVRIYQNFMDQVGQMGLDVDGHDDSPDIHKRMLTLKEEGAGLRNEKKSLYVNHISPACQACQTSVGSTTFFISLKCHRDCFFCFNPNQEDYEFHLTHTRDLVAELDALRASGQRVLHLALTGGEPLLYKEETIKFFRHARQNFPNAYTRLYTSGDQLDRETLQSFKQAGLNEIRFSIRLHDTDNAIRHTYKQITLAAEYIPHVMVEMPVLPGSLEETKDILLKLEELCVFGINLLELCFPFHNAEIFRERGYRIKARPFRVLYDYWYGGGVPIAGSEAVCLDLIDFALKARLKLGVHYCSLENKHTGQLYRQNSGQSMPHRVYFSQRDYFLKTAKVFGEDIPAVQKMLEKSGYRDSYLSEQHNSLEFHVNQISSLKRLNIEVGISSQVFETRDKERVMRELKVDVTTPQTFRLSTDI